MQQLPPAGEPPDAPRDAPLVPTPVLLLPAPLPIDTPAPEAPECAPQEAPPGSAEAASAVAPAAAGSAPVPTPLPAPLAAPAPESTRTTDARRAGRLARVLQRAALCLGALAGGAIWALFLAAPGVIGPASASTAPAGPLMGASIGGLAEAFDARFGTPTFAAGQAYYPARLADGTHVLVCVCRTMPGVDGQAHAVLLNVQSAPGAQWSVATAPGAVATLLLPPDAAPAGEAGSDVGPLHLYRSAGLAATFLPSAFVDATTGALVPPGTTSVACDEVALGGCIVAMGR